jgi:hypothetical protein
MQKYQDYSFIARFQTFIYRSEIGNQHITIQHKN